MANPVTVLLTAFVRATEAGDLDIRESWTINSPAGLVFQQTLTQAAFNTISFTSGKTMLMVIPPTSNTQNVTLKGVTGDTGTNLNVALPTPLFIPTSSTSIGITLGAGSDQVFKFVAL